MPTLIDNFGNTYRDDMGKANALRRFFAKVFESDVPETLLTSFLATKNITDSCDKVKVTAELVYETFRLKSSITVTYDRIPQIIFKICAKIISFPFVTFFNVSLSTGNVPKIWKESLVTAIPKKISREYLI